MPIQKRWSTYSKNGVQEEDDNLGVYELGTSSGNILYIGEGKVKNRLIDHFSDGGTPIPGASVYRVKYTNSKRRANQKQRVHLRQFKKRHGKLPKFNQRINI